MEFIGDYQIEYHKGACTDEMLALRRYAFRDEKKFLSEEDLESENDLKGIHILVRDVATQKLAGITHYISTKDSDFLKYANISVEAVENTFYSTRSMVSPEFRTKGLFPFLLYLALRANRIQGCKKILGFIEEGNPPIKKMTHCTPMKNVPPRRIQGYGGYEYNVIANVQDIDYAINRCFNLMSKSLRRAVSSLMADEIRSTTKNRVIEFYKNPWVRNVHEGTLTKRQYTVALKNLHQYVRWTTRLLARIAGVTEDSLLRNHFIEHLTEEIDHEKQIEQDLLTLDEDIDFVRNIMQPDTNIRLMMAIQESWSAFHQNPVQFLAVPFAVEGLSAFLSKDFLRALEKCIQGWGVKHPKKAMSFFVSHVSYDGGHNGHWEQGAKVIASYIKSEVELQTFLTTVHAVIDAQDESYTTYAKEWDLVNIATTRSDFDGASYPSATMPISQNIKQF